MSDSEIGSYYIGLISGTSMDGIDAALVEFGESSLEILQTRKHEYPGKLHQQLVSAVRDPDTCTANTIGQLDRRVGECFRDAANALLADARIDPSAVTAIGSHGQTLQHRPDAAHPFSLQIGDAAVIATGTGITTIADFRRADLALGGQGAPLTPAFHEWLFRRAGSHRTILNVGGFGNITILPADNTTPTGFDTGPGNTLLDAWIRKHKNESFDRNGAWAAAGSVNEALLSRLLADPYFSAAPPKSTGFEYFNLQWLDSFAIDSIDAVDIQATLCALSAASIADAIQVSAADTTELLVCGGGVHNAELMRQLDARLPTMTIASSATVGLDPDWVEAAAFAWLAMRRTHDQTGNLPSVTGASKATVLGAVYAAG